MFCQAVPVGLARTMQPKAALNLRCIPASAPVFPKLAMKKSVSAGDAYLHSPRHFLCRLVLSEHTVLWVFSLSAVRRKEIIKSAMKHMRTSRPLCRQPYIPVARTTQAEYNYSQRISQGAELSSLLLPAGTYYITPTCTLFFFNLRNEKAFCKSWVGRYQRLSFN